jgi:ribosomal-protein-alanine N-acetyltransferase
MLIQTKRLILRNFEPSDFESFALLAADPEVMQFSLKGPMSKEQSKEHFEKRILSHYQKYGFGLLATFLKDTQEFIGFVGLITQNIDEKEEIELAYRLFPKYWSQGFATEAANAVCEYAFRVLKTERLISLIDPKNHSSLRVAKRVGMHFWKHSIFHNTPVQVYCLLKIVVTP